MRSVPWVCLVAVISPACKQQAPAPAPAPVPAPKDDLTPPADARVLPSGLRTLVLAKGTGTEHPQPQDLVEVHYTGWKGDGTRFDSSRDRNAPAQFTVEGTIKGWSEGMQLMVTGEKRRLWVPPELAYGDKPGPRAPAGPLVFDVELLKIIKQPAPLPAPPDSASPPRKKTGSGLAYRVLQRGTGKKHPHVNSIVEVHYTGWGPDGRMLDSSVLRGHPVNMAILNTAPGWREALQLMVVGEKTRFWIPESLAAQMGAQARTAVYDVELLELR